MGVKMKKKKQGGRGRMRYVLPVLLLLFAMTAGFFTAEGVFAATTVTLEPGDTYDFSTKSNYKKYGAFYVDINKPGEYHLKGSASNAMVRVDAPEGKTVFVNLEGVRLTPSDEAPGTGSDRAAVEIAGGGGTVILYTKENGHWGDGTEGNFFEGQGRMPAIRKDNTSTKLVFNARSDSEKLIAKADKDAFRTCAIGCYSKDAGILSRLYSQTTGNIWFEGGYVEAWGSQNFKDGGALGYDRWDGGAAIGANGYGSVDGLTINGGSILAVAGDTGCAGIGTSSCVDTGPLLSYPLMCSSAKNITINGGTVRVEHFADVLSKGATATQSGTGASIGGGYRTDVKNLTIKGGDISNTSSAYLPGTGIGAGEEGDAEIKISGGKIDVKARYVGIGAHAIQETDFDIPVAQPDPQNEPDSDDSLSGKNLGWFGDVNLDITGGDIKVNSDKVCLGGGIPNSKNAYVEIDGGNLDLISNGGEIGPIIGPSIFGGKLRRITIRGGIINAHRETNPHNAEEHVASIGNAHHPDLSEHLNSNSIVEYIEIMGGTLRVTEGDHKTPGTIGGNQGKNYNRDYTTVIIGGGNVYASMLDGEKTQPVNKLNSDDAVPVFCQKIDLKVGEQYADRDVFPVTEHRILLGDGTEYAYGLQDCNLFKANPELWFWLPINAQWGKIKTRNNPFRGLNATEFSGFLRYGGNGETFDFYPPVYLVLSASGGEDGQGKVLYGDTKLTDFHPVQDSGFAKLISTYNSKRTGGFPVLDRSGGFVEGGNGAYINDQDRWVFIGTNGTVDPDVFNSALGTTLYAITGDYVLNLHYDQNLPAHTASTLTGTMPPDEQYLDNSLVTLPAESGANYGFRLNGYTFTGWNTKADGSGTPYSAGQSGIPVTEFKTSATADTVTLYAQWEPIKYTVKYSSVDPQLGEKSVEYTYDEAVKVPWASELQSWGGTWAARSSLLTGWTYQDKDGHKTKYGKHDELLSFTDFAENGDPQPRTLQAVWTQAGELCVKVLVDGKGVSGLARDIKITDQYSCIPQTEFKEDEEEPGLYRNICSTPIPDGTYTVSIGQRLLDPDDATFEYRRTVGAYVELSSCTVTVQKGPNINVKSVGIDPSDDTGGEKATVPAGTEVRIDAQAWDGFVISGWTCEGTEPQWDPAKATQTIRVNGKCVLTPQVRPFEYTVVFDPNNGANPRSEDATGKMQPQTFKGTDEKELTRSAFRKKGYEQSVSYHNSGENRTVAWNTRSDGEGAGYEDGQLIPAGRPLTWEDGAEVKLYAQWTPKRYTVRYVDPSGTYPEKSQNHVYDEVFRISDSPGEREGYDFLGWKQKDLEQAPLRQPGDEVTNLCAVDDNNALSNVTFEAVWLNRADIYTVVFDPNDTAYPGTQPAAGSMEDQEMVRGTKRNLSGNRFSKTGYRFLCWNTAPDGSGTRYVNKESVMNIAAEGQTSVTLYARWEPLKYTITYIDPYRFCSTQRQTVDYDAAANLIGADDPDWQPTGHSLQGWEGTALGSFYEPGQEIRNLCTVSEDGSLEGKTLYASWNDQGNILVTITLDNQGAAVDPDDIELISGTDGTTYSGCFVKESDNPGRFMYDPGATEPIPEGDYTVHLNHYDSYGLADARETITYDSQTAASAHLASDTVKVEKGEHVSSVQVTDPASDPGGETPGKSVVVVYGAKAAIAAKVTEQGYHFDSYAVSGTMPDMDPAQPNQEITVYGPVTLTAQAAPNTYYIHFDPNDAAYPDAEPASGSMEDQIMTYDRKSALDANAFQRTGYGMSGWNTKEDGNGDAFGDTAEVCSLASGQGDTVTLFAQWKINEYTVRFESNGGSEVAPQTVCYREKAVKPDDPTRKKYQFLGWYTDEELTEAYDFSTEVTDDLVLYAKWKKTEDPTPVKPAKAGSVLLVKMTASGKRSCTISWNKIKGAAGYDIFFCRCNGKSGMAGMKKIKTIKAGEKCRWTKTGLKKKKAYKVVVKAYAVKDGKKKYIKASPMAHTYTSGATRNYTNAKALTVNRTKVTLKAGKTFRVKAKITKLKKKKKLMRDRHVSRLRYLSADKKIATVSRSGVIEAKAKGTCTVYVYTHNGISKAITVTVL